MRIGCIAAMPGEHVSRPGKIPARVYLAEVRSIGGLSGSPVFVDLAGTRRHFGTMTIAPGANYKLLGTVKGHFDDKQPEAPIDDIRLSAGDGEYINMGIAMIVPASDLADLLERNDNAGHRAALLAAVHRKKESKQNTMVDD